jgi:hypothetical protein
LRRTHGSHQRREAKYPTRSQHQAIQNPADPAGKMKSAASAPLRAKIFLELRARKSVFITAAVRKFPRQRLLALFACPLLSACSLIAHYDQVAYEHATSAKVDTLRLMDKATESYSDHAQEVEALMTELDKAYEYDRGRQLNRITVAQWDVLRDPNRNLVGGFFKMWKAKDHLSAAFVAEKKKQIADAFDQIIQLEAGKLKTARGVE